MSYSSTVVEVLIASPSDVLKERELVTQAIYEWNASNSKYEGIVLLPIKWETHSTPEYDGLDTQEVLNRQFVRECDILVGIMWTKVGSPTQKANSGTLEEIEEFIKTRKPIKMYFSKASLPHDVNTVELEKLRTFKKTYQNQGIYKDYEDLKELKEQVMKDLTYEVRKIKKNIISNSNKNHDSIELLKRELYILKKENEIDIDRVAYNIIQKFVTSNYEIIKNANAYQIEDLLINYYNQTANDMEKFILLNNNILMQDENELELTGFGIEVFAKYLDKDVDEFYDEDEIAQV
ncbi:hypothetical protein SIL80_21925 [Bacillus cereus group sp. BfR-BA-01119]|nr:MULTISPECIES: hypothetical protein [unclassified Bacillus cereus group]MDX5868493.1 hypothetical protein [Bacillus cereus group sp. BfR-BA-01119]MDX5911125.1 hypothetical protein [Bacillus cereus group sp. BfR-BA-01029]